MNQPPNMPGIEPALPTRYGPQELTIRGGSLSARPDDLQALLDAWKLPRADTPRVLAEWVHDLQLLSAAAWSAHPGRGRVDLLERLRIFGLGGDFELRRDEDRLFWRWIGPAEAVVPASGEHAGRDFWAADHQPAFVRREIEHLLWGKLDQKTRVWVDDRLARTPLHYPVEPQAKIAERVVLRGWQFIADGTAQFVWWTELQGRPAR
jgi:hypothetical protein